MKEELKKYMFKEDYHFDNDVYGVRKLGAKVYQWWAKRGDVVIGKPFVDELVKGYISLEGEKRGLVESAILEEVLTNKNK